MMETTTARPVSVGAIVAEFVGALVGMLVLAAVLYYAIGLLFWNSGMGMGLLALQIYGAILGAAIGAGVGAGLAGRAMKQAGSMSLAILLAVVFGVVTAVVPRIFPVRLGLFETLSTALVLTLVGAVAGYNMRRKG
jgi:hypothetical protein